MSEAHVEEVLESLAETPLRIAALTVGFAELQLNARRNEKTWSANDILAHLRACADVWGKSIEDMLTQDGPTLRHVSPRTYMRKTDYPRRSFHESFQAFSDQRAELLYGFQNLNAEEWSRGAKIKDRVHTVLRQARRMAQHEDVHGDQIQAVLETA